MRRQVLSTLVTLALVAVAPAAQPSSEDLKIEALILAIESLEGAVFIRNDGEHTSREAADHLRMKWRSARGRITTAREFIEHLASRSSASGEPYRIRFADGREVTSEAFLTAELEKLERSGGPTSRPRSRPATRPDQRADPQESDPQAVEVARAVLERLGGREAWEQTRYVTWNFFGVRRHLWDRRTGSVRIEGTDRDSGEPYLILVDLHTGRGRAWQGGEEVNEPEELRKLLELGKSAWINDSYWLLMPYKLLDPGVILKDLGERPMTDGRAARVLELTFDGVGETPRNKYHVYVAADTGLVEQWDFYADRDDAEPRFRIPWRNWRRHGRIMLSGDRGERGGRARELTDIAVLERVPAEAFASPAPLDWGMLIEKGTNEPRD